MARAETHVQHAPRLTWRNLAGLFEEAWRREQRRRHWWLLAVVLLVAAGVFTAVLTGGSGNGSSGLANVAMLRSHAPSAPGSSSPVRSRFAVFNQPAASPQAVRRSIRNYPSLAGWLTSKSGIGLKHPATHIVHTSEGTVWVVTGSNLRSALARRGRTYVTSGGAACVITPDLVYGSDGAQAGCGGLMGRNALASTQGSGDTSAWDGLVPNSVKRVIVSYASGRKTTVPVIDNTFFVRLREPMQKCQSRRTLKELASLSTTAKTLTIYCRA